MLQQEKRKDSIRNLTTIAVTLINTAAYQQLELIKRPIIKKKKPQVDLHQKGKI